MKKKIICIGIISIFLLTGLTAVLGVGRGITNINTLNPTNQPPTMMESTAIWSIIYNKNGMGAGPFTAKAEDPEDDECRLCVYICEKDNTTNNKSECSDYSTDWHTKRLTISLNPADCPIGTYFDYDMWIEDTHGAESNHEDGEFYIKRSQSKTSNLFQILLGNHPNLFALLRNLIKL